MPEMTRTLFVVSLLVLTSRCLRQYFRLYSTIVFLLNIDMQINAAGFQCGKFAFLGFSSTDTAH